jgi:DNA-binding Lrp family transcriptional regulator
MNLTQRRKEFLHKIVNLFRQTGLPVHYATVAQALGVSKWTAYDILKELEKGDFLRREYTLSRSKKAPGRSMVVFRPTEKALKLLPPQEVKSKTQEDWSTARSKLLSLVDNMKNLNPQKIKEELLEEMSRIELPVVFSAYTIALLITHIHEINSRGMAALKHILELAPKPELVLSLFAGSAIGTMLKSMKDTVNSKILSCIRRFEEHISRCDHNECRILASFLSEALQRSR